MIKQNLLYFIMFLFLASHSLPLNAQKKAIWDYSRISVSGHYQATQGNLKDELPYGWGTTFAFDQGLDKLTGKRFIWMPGFRFEFGYLEFREDESEIGGMSMNAGPVWLISPFNKKWGSFSIAALPGISMVAVKDEDTDTIANIFSLQGFVLYEYHFSNVFLFAGGRYTYLHNETSPLTGISGIAGIGYLI